MSSWILMVCVILSCEDPVVFQFPSWEKCIAEEMRINHLTPRFETRCFNPDEPQVTKLKVFK